MSTNYNIGLCLACGSDLTYEKQTNLCKCDTCKGSIPLEDLFILHARILKKPYPRPTAYFRLLMSEIAAINEEDDWENPYLK